MNIYQRLNAIMSKVNYVQKEDKKVNNQYKFVSHDAVTSAVQPYLVEFGVVPVPTVINRVQDGNRTEVDVRVDFVNMDTPEEIVSVTMFGYGVDQQDKGPGKAFSYAKKYAFLQLFCLATGDDPERDNVDHKKTASKLDVKSEPVAEIVFINEEQFIILSNLIKDTKTDVDKFCKFMGVENISQITNFDKAKHALEQKAKK